MTIRVMVELEAHAGQRDQLPADFEQRLEDGSNLSGFLGSRRYEKLDDPDVLVEMAEGESIEAREAHIRDAAASGTCARLVRMVAEPLRVAVLRPLA